jgi:CRISPR type I-E-associated protein CasB/Cse2
MSELKTETRDSPKEKAAQFVGALRKAKSNRGKMSALRRGLIDNPRMHVDAWPVIADLGGDIRNPSHIAVAAFYATHPEESNARNFGETCRIISTGSDNKLIDSFETRFRRLLASNEVEDVIAQLRSWVRFAESKGTGINYESLFLDLHFWPWSAERTRVQWAASFWKSGAL